MAKKDTSKTNVTARAALKAQAALCRICGQKPENVRVLGASGKARMIRKRNGVPCEVCSREVMV